MITGPHTILMQKTHEADELTRYLFQVQVLREERWNNVSGRPNVTTSGSRSRVAHYGLCTVFREVDWGLGGALLDPDRFCPLKNCSLLFLNHLYNEREEGFVQ